MTLFSVDQNEYSTNIVSWEDKRRLVEVYNTRVIKKHNSRQYFLDSSLV